MASPLIGEFYQELQLYTHSGGFTLSLMDYAHEPLLRLTERVGRKKIHHLWSLRPKPDIMISNAHTFYLSGKAWWQESSLFQRWTPASLLLLFLGLHGLLGGLRSDHFVISATMGVLYYIGPLGHFLLRFLMPLLVVLIVYDSQQYYAPLIHLRSAVPHPYFLLNLRLPLRLYCRFRPDQQPG